MTRDTEDVVALIEETRRAAAIGRSSCNITAQKLGNHLNTLADTAQLLSDRIDVLEGLARRIYACRMDAGEGRFVNLAKLRPVIGEIGVVLGEDQ